VGEVGGCRVVELEYRLIAVVGQKVSEAVPAPAPSSFLWTSRL